MQAYTVNLLKNIKYIDLTDKPRIHRELVENVLNRTTTIFKWTGLPWDYKIMELMLQNQGQIIIADSPEGIMPYANVYPQGIMNAMYLPEDALLTNPYLKTATKPTKIGINSVLGLNDTNGVGVMPHVNRMCTLLTECIVSMYDSLINCRMQTIISAKDDETFKSASNYIRSVINGDIAIIGDAELLNGDGLSVHPSNVGNNNITELLEMYNTLSAMLYSEYGLNVSTNVKREYVNDSQTGNNETMIFNMLECRLKLCDDLKRIFDIDASVDYSDAVKSVIEQDNEIISGEENTKDNTDQNNN